MGIMDFFGEHSVNNDKFNEMTHGKHTAKLSHELLASAAAFEAAKAYEDHCAKNGKPDSHAKAKEILAALTAGVIDRMVETKGLDFIDTQKAKHAAQKHAEAAFDQSDEF